MTKTESLYRVRHVNSCFRGRIVRVLIRMSPKWQPNHMLVECVDSVDERFTCREEHLRQLKESIA